jgi:Na+(H+)/acetate symporter ActP
MINNMHVIDRIIRVAIAILIIIFYFTGQMSGLAAIILELIAVIFLVTSFIGYCPVYQLLGISTKDWGKKK